MDVYNIQDNYLGFVPDLTPIEMIELGVFGGSYFRKSIGDWTKFTPSEFISEIISNFLVEFITNDTYDVSFNKYKVNCGSTYDIWLANGWIKEEDPFGWFNWYINFYYGRRSVDDKRQIGRWKAFKSRHAGMLRAHPNSAKTRQNMIHWAIDADKLLIK